MKKIIFSTMIASLLAFVGCQNEELVNNSSTDNSEKKVILTANIQGSSATRVALNTDIDENENPIVKVNWKSSGEMFYVYNADFSQSGEFKQIADNQFEGVFPANATGAYYGNYTVSGSSVSYDLSAQNGTLTESSILMKADLTSTSLEITFQHQTAILKPTFFLNSEDTDNTITKIVMKGVNAGSDKTSITVEPSALNDIYIFLPIETSYAADYTFTFSVTAGGNEYTGSLTIPANKSVEAGNFYTAEIVLQQINPGDELSYDSSTKTFSVSGPKGFQLLNKWMANKITKDEFLNYQFNGYQHAKDVDFNSNPWNISLTEDIRMPSVGDSESNWIPVSFKGTFEGNNHTIYNLTINDNTTTSGSFALISELSGYSTYVRGIIRNLTLEDVRVNTKTTGSVGAFVGTCKGSYSVSITNCHVINGYISGKKTVGGIAGFSKGDAVGIENCTVSGSVVLDGNDTWNDQFVGGIVGQMTRGCIKNCTNNAIVQSLAGTVYAGGIVGLYNGTVSGSDEISGCTNSQSAKITVVNTYAGSNSNWSESNVGGVIGSHGTTDTKALRVYGCINHADINISVGQYGSHYVGGIIGVFLNKFDLRASANTGTLDVNNTTSNENIYVGGIMGYANKGTSEYEKTEIVGCWTKNVVEYNKTMVTSGFDGVGYLASSNLNYQSSFFAQGETEAEQQLFVNSKVGEMNGNVLSGWKWKGNENGWPNL